MVIELSGVQFGLKSYAWFEITSMISDQTCTTRSSIAPLFTTRFWSVPLYIEPVASLSKSETSSAFTCHFKNMSASCQRDVIGSCDCLFCFTVLFSLNEKKMQFRAQNSAIWEKIAPLRANQIATIISDFKMDLINFIILSFVYLCLSFINVFLLHISSHSKVCHFTRFSFSDQNITSCQVTVDNL